MSDEAVKTSISFEQILLITNLSDSHKPKPLATESPQNLPEEQAMPKIASSGASSPLPEHEKRALDELKQLLRVALDNHTLLSSSLPPTTEKKRSTDEEGVVTESVNSETVTATVDEEEDGSKTVEAIAETVVPPQVVPVVVPEPQKAESETDLKSGAEEVSIWGIPLLKDERTDVVLWKFLRARDFKPNDAFSMLKSTIQWRKEFRIEELMNEEFEDETTDFNKVVYMEGESKEGSPVCYNVFGEFKRKELYNKVLADEEKRRRFLRWRIRFLERSVRGLDFGPGRVSTIVQVNDLRDSPGLGKWELRVSTKQALQLLQDNYPEFVAKQVFINVPWWYLAVNKMISPFMTQRTKSKFVFAGPSRSAESLFNYIAPEKVPVRYGGLSCEDGEFSPEDAASQITIKPGCIETLDFSVSEECLLTWEFRVVGWEVSYGVEFVPSALDAYTVIIQKMRKVTADESVIRSSYKVGEEGKVVLRIENATSRKKKLLYRLKAKSVSN